jgi:hypothetical protein
VVKRNRIVRVRLTEEQLNRLLREAELEGLTVSQLVRRRLFYHGKQYKRPYTVKHAKRTGKPTLEQIRQYVAQHPELFQSNVERRSPPKDMAELGSLMFHDVGSLFLNEYLPVVLSMRQAVESSVAKHLGEGKSGEESDGKWRDLERKVENFKEICQMFQAYLKMQEEKGGQNV